MIFHGIFALISAIAAAITFYIITNDASLKTTNPYFGGAIAFAVTYLIVCVYSVPMLVAHYRKHPQLTAIVVLNIAGGWFFIVWIAALVWAVYKPNQQKSE